MVKVIKSKHVQAISSHNVPYKNKWGHFVWYIPGITFPIETWPGIKPPAWVKDVVNKGGKWCWTDEPT